MMYFGSTTGSPYRSLYGVRSMLSCPARCQITARLETRLVSQLLHGDSSLPEIPGLPVLAQCVVRRAEPEPKFLLRYPRPLLVTRLEPPGLIWRAYRLIV